MAITAKQVKELREMTGAGMMDCKKALGQTDGDMDKAVEWLRENGLAKAARTKNSRIMLQKLQHRLRQHQQQISTLSLLSLGHLTQALQ